MSDSLGAVARPAVESDVAEVVGLHVSRIGEGFVVTLGPRFLNRLYRRVLRSQMAFMLVAEIEGDVRGFVAVALSTGRLYREFLVRDGIAAGGRSGSFHCSGTRSRWETLRYGFDEGDVELPAAEILSIAVDADFGGRGVGAALLNTALEELQQQGVHAARVVTAVGNEAGIKMYRRAGFQTVTQTEVHRGAPQELMVWR